MKKIAAIVLAAGEGKRMKSKDTNKVVAVLGNKQLILHAVDKLKELRIDPIVVVVGFAKESVMKVLNGGIIFADQKERLGTAHAVSVALEKLPEDVQTVLVTGGDDSAFYTREVLMNLIKTHLEKNAKLSLLTIEVNNPVGTGRVIRDNNGIVNGVIEEKDATEDQRKIKEVNSGCYVFEVSFLRQNLNKVKKSPVTGEYYLTSLINIAIENNEKVEAVRGGKIPWRGVNTPEELIEAEKLF